MEKKTIILYFLENNNLENLQNFDFFTNYGLNVKNWGNRNLIDFYIIIKNDFKSSIKNIHKFNNLVTIEGNNIKNNFEIYKENLINIIGNNKITDLYENVILLNSNLIGPIYEFGLGIHWIDKYTTETFKHPNNNFVFFKTSLYDFFIENPNYFINNINDKNKIYFRINYIPKDFDTKSYAILNNLLNTKYKTPEQLIYHYIKFGSKENLKYKIINNDINNIIKEDVKDIIDESYEKCVKQFCDIYKVSKEDVFKYSKIEFKYFCFRYLNYMRNIELPEIKLGNNYESVLIEFRILPHVEFLIRNIINKLGKKWSHTIVCGKSNYNFFIDMCKNISPNIRIICLEYNNITRCEYCKILTSTYFWNLFHGEKILIYQEDTCVFKTNIEDFLEWDYIGAPWPKENNDTTKENGLEGIQVGNGGLSLRSKSIMIEIINKISLNDTKFNSSTLNYMKRSGLYIGPEDVYFSKNMQDFNIGKIADWNTACLFSCESFFNENSFGGHQFWISNKDWKKLLYDNVVIQFKPNYELKYLEHRGGWKSILNNLTLNDFFNSNSKIDFFDIIENYFLWNKTFKCTNKWGGVIHCTQYTPSHLDICNIKFLFENDNFIKSLDNCIFIISLSTYVTDYLKKKFENLNKFIKIYTIKHPVDSNNIIYFNYNNYLNNSEKYVVFIGQQLRKITSIYLLNTNRKKIWLTGSKNFNKCKKILGDEIDYLKIDKTKINFNNVNMYYTETFEEYDKILSENIVFIDLFDAAANNTVLECIIRNTPIIINKLPGVVEYLGENYPLYFKDITEIDNLLNNDKILCATKYLEKMDKHDLSIENFTKKIFTSLVNIN